MLKIRKKNSKNEFVIIYIFSTKVRTKKSGHFIYVRKAQKPNEVSGDLEPKY